MRKVTNREGGACRKIHGHLRIVLYIDSTPELVLELAKQHWHHPVISGHHLTINNLHSDVMLTPHVTVT